MVTEPLQVALQVAGALEQCGVRYLVGGSLASSVSGEPRSTLDVGLVVSLDLDQVEPLLALLGDEFYADAEMLREAVRTRSSANLIHRGTSTKVDLFVLGGSPLDSDEHSSLAEEYVAEFPAGTISVRSKPSTRCASWPPAWSESNSRTRTHRKGLRKPAAWLQRRPLPSVRFRPSACYSSPQR